MGPRLFTPWQVAAATALGGPLAGCWLMARNYRLLGPPQSAWHTMAWGIGGTLALIGMAYVLPRNFPPLIIPLGVMFGLQQTAAILQGPAVNDHAAAGGNTASWLHVLGISLLFVPVDLGLLLITMSILGPLPGM